MMTETFKNTETPIISAIGIGEDSKEYIDEIKGWNSHRVKNIAMLTKIMAIYGCFKIPGFTIQGMVLKLFNIGYDSRNRVWPRDLF